jgi:hypothetical protein
MKKQHQIVNYFQKLQLHTRNLLDWQRLRCLSFPAKMPKQIHRTITQ